MCDTHFIWIYSLPLWQFSFCLLCILVWWIWGTFIRLLLWKTLRCRNGPSWFSECVSEWEKEWTDSLCQTIKHRVSNEQISLVHRFKLTKCQQTAISLVAAAAAAVTAIAILAVYSMWNVRIWYLILQGSTYDTIWYVMFYSMVWHEITTIAKSKHMCLIRTHKYDSYHKQHRWLHDLFCFYIRKIVPVVRARRFDMMRYDTAWFDRCFCIKCGSMSTAWQIDVWQSWIKVQFMRLNLSLGNWF